jgi:GGDEF domain-containing protein
MENVSKSPFIEKVGLELQRAERYSIFISLTVLDLSFLNEIPEDERTESLKTVLDVVSSNVRAIDSVSVMNKQQLGLLMPETSRQGAETVAKRIVSLIKGRLAGENRLEIGDVIPLQMASFPDTAGAKPIRELLKEWSDRNRN